MKVLLLGKNGQLGRELQRSLVPLGAIIALDRNSTDFCGDLTRLEALAQTIRRLQPDVIVNAAAYTNVKGAEANPDLARTVNALAPSVLAREAASLGAWLIHYSTDYVFDGGGIRPWLESDSPHPLNVYGQTKLEGEQLVQAACPHHLILRTSWLYAAHGENFISTIMRLSRQRARLEVVNDQLGAPTGADLLADVTVHALRLAHERPELSGLYHVAAAGETSWHAYAKYVLEWAGRSQPASEIPANEVIPVASRDFEPGIDRPLNCRLDTSKARLAFGLTLPPWQQGVAIALDSMLAEFRRAAR